MRLQEWELEFDLLTAVPISPARRRKRGYDQVGLLMRAVSRELGIPMAETLKKVRNAPPQSGLSERSQRKANVLGAFRPVHPERFAGKRVLLLDDIVTTGATASECARVLLTAGAKEVKLAAIAAARHKISR